MQNGDPVVLLETAVVTSGLPRTPWVWPGGDLVVDRARDWRPEEPTNLELARNMELSVRAAGAVPATIAIMDGHWKVGLTTEELERLARDDQAGKASVSSAAAVLRSGRSAGTTVSGVLIAAGLLQEAGHPTARVMATGGIGGVHHGWSTRPDVSADLELLARSRVAVVSAGVKSIVDVPATGEWLETLGVPILGLETAVMPCFIAGVDPGAPAVHPVADLRTAASIVRTHWSSVNPRGGVLVAVPGDPRLALAPEIVADANQRAETEAAARGITGPPRTPFLLETMARETQGASLIANVALLLANAGVAAELAIGLS